MTTNISMLAVDLSKGSFQVCAVGSDGTVLFNRALSRARFSALLADQPACIVAMEACATSHHWGRVAQKNGHEVRIVPAVFAGKGLQTKPSIDEAPYGEGARGGSARWKPAPHTATPTH